MLKIITGSLFVLALSFVSSAQTTTLSKLPEGSYQLVVKTQLFNTETLHMTDLDMLDLYRAENADNTIIITQNDESVTLLLLSAAKCRQLGVAYNEGLVKKGEMMGTNPNTAANFHFEITEKLQLKDKTVY